MRLRRILVAALALAAPALMAIEPAEALTSRQYQHQGHGRYINSTGSRVMSPMARGHHRFHGHRQHRRHHR